MATIKLGAQFFKKERDSLYSNWKQAYWREMIQNSVDARARRIDITMTPGTVDGLCIMFLDDGCGMTRQVLEDVFFALGETTKTGLDTVGGFGRARVLTCFSMGKYCIWTKNLWVEGSGAEYKIEPCDVRTDGCKFQMFTRDAEYNEMMVALSGVLQRSQLPCDVYINGAKWKDWTYRRSATRTLDCGSVYVNKSQQSGGRIVVRVNGLWMFDIWTDCEFQVIVEVDVNKSRKILSAARDSFHYQYQRNLEQWVAELTVDRKSALRDARKNKTTLIKGRGARVLTLAPVERKPSTDNLTKVAALVMTPGTLGLLGDKPIVSERLKVGMVAGGESRHEQLKGSLDLDSVYIQDETENAQVRKVIDKYNPTNWVESVKNIRGQVQSYKKGANYRKLLIAWQVACEHALMALMKYNEIQSLSWMVGWAFRDDAEAIHVKVDGGGSHALCLNPVGEDGRMKYSFKRREDLLALLALAKHEAAHVSVDVHNESYSTVHTAIDKRFDTAVVLRAIREALSVG